MPECTCPKCIECCERRPGWFKPGEAEKAARLLRMSLQDFFNKYLVVDYWARMEGDINLLMPRQVDAAGRRLSYSDAFRVSPCVFLQNDRCGIHAAKPYECKVAMGCDNSEVGSWHKKAAKAWDKPKHQTQVENLLKE